MNVRIAPFLRLAGKPFALTAGFLAVTAGIIFYAQTTLLEIEQTLPVTVLEQERDIALLVQATYNLMNAVKLARVNPIPGRIDKVLAQVDIVDARLKRIRSTYNFDNLVGTSAIHAVVNPALADIKIWLSVGIYDFAPDSLPVLRMVEVRTEDTLEVMKTLFVGAGETASEILKQQSSRIETFRNIIIVVLMVMAAMAAILVFHIHRLRITEEELQKAHDELEIRVEERTKELQESHVQLGKLSQTVEQSPNMMMITDTEGNIEYANAKFYEVTGYSPEEVLGQNPRIIKSGKTPRSVYEGLWRTIKAGKVWQNEIEDRCKDGRTFWADVTITPIHSQDGIVTHYFASHENINMRKEAEKKMWKAKEQAENASRAKSEFLSSMSHELRTPMNAILGFGQMLEFNPKEPLTKTQKISVQHILNGGQHLLELIDEVLDLAKIEAGKMELAIEDVSVRTVLDECLTLINSMADERGIEITVEEGFETSRDIRTDHTRFRQSLLNLMSNAVKYNRPNGKVILDCQEIPGGMLHITVADTGNGIPEDMQGELFEPFNRLPMDETTVHLRNRFREDLEPSKAVSRPISRCGSSPGPRLA